MGKHAFYVRKGTSFLNIYITSRHRQTELYNEELYDPYSSPVLNQGRCDGRGMWNAQEREEIVKRGLLGK